MLEWDRRRRALSSAKVWTCHQSRAPQVYISSIVAHSDLHPERRKSRRSGPDSNPVGPESSPWQLPPVRRAPWSAPGACARAPGSSCARPSSANPARPARPWAPAPASPPAASCRPATSPPSRRASAQSSWPPSGPWGLRRSGTVKAVKRPR